MKEILTFADQLAAQDNAVVLPVRAFVEDLADGEQTLDNIYQAFKVAGEEARVGPIQDGKPRMMKVTAWMLHAGKPNQNRHAFILEDLQKAVDNGLFQAPYLGMIDFNHDFTAYGAWYSAKIAFDDRPEVQQWGVIIEGAVWAWRYEELAQLMMATMARQGYIDVSMACIADRYEEARDENNRKYDILRDPVFFCTSLLDVDPADPNSNAIATEDSSSTSQEREMQLLKVAELDDSRIKASWSLNPESIRIRIADNQEVQMDLDQVIARLREALAADLKDSEVAGLLQDFMAKVPVLEAEVVALTAQVEALTAEKAAAEGKVTDTEVALQTTQDALAALNTEVEELRAFKAEKDAEQVAADKAALIAARLAELSEGARKVFDALEAAEQEATKERWGKMSQEDWASTVTLLNSASVASRVSYEERSRRQTKIVSDAGTPDREFRIRKHINRKG